MHLFTAESLGVAGVKKVDTCPGVRVTVSQPGSKGGNCQMGWNAWYSRTSRANCLERRTQGEIFL